MKIVKFVVIGIFVFYLNTIVSFSCSIFYPPIDKFDRTEYVFIGKVIGVTEEATSQLKASQPKPISQTWGLIIELEYEVFLPKKPKKYFEVYPFELAGSCGSIGTHKQTLLNSFPIGTQIRVIAHESNFFKNSAKSQNIKLDVASWRRESLQRNTFSDGTSMTTLDSVFNYNDFYISLANNNSQPTYIERNYKTFPAIYKQDEESLIIESQFTIPFFELKKDLLRLEKTSSEKERFEILERLLYYARSNAFKFEVIAKRYLHNREELNRLLRKKEELDKYKYKLN